jgi:Uma2 family endonuclease
MSLPANDFQTSEIATAYPSSVVRNEVFYPAEIESEMGETELHFKFIRLFSALLESFFAERQDVAVNGNMMVYYEAGDSKKWFAPDVFVCFGVENKLRRVFKTWEEGVFPQVVFEIASEGTFENDLGGKRLDYARLGVEEYYLLDPEREYLPSPLMAFHRQQGRLLSAGVDSCRVFSPLLNLDILDTGRSFRLFDPVKQEFLRAVLTGED